MEKLGKLIIVILIIFFSFFLFRNIKNYRINKIITEDYEPKYKINELYKLNKINYKLLLNKKEKKIYETIIENLINFEDEFKIDVSELNISSGITGAYKILDIVSAILMDHPELIHVATCSVSQTKVNDKVTIYPEYIMSKEEYTKNIKEIEEVIEKVKKETNNLDEYNKVKYVYDYIGKSNHYGNTSDYKAQSAYSAFNKDLSPVCAGYAKASQILFNNIGVNSLLIYGSAEYALFLGRGHAWNIVEIESKYYLYDVTMSSGNSDNKFYRGFLIDGEKHSPSYKKSYPYLNGKKYKNNYQKD